MATMTARPVDSGFSIATDPVAVEPNEEFKRVLKAAIEKELEPMVEDAKAHKLRSLQGDSSKSAIEKSQQDFEAAMKTYRRLAEERYMYELHREGVKGKWAATGRLELDGDGVVGTQQAIFDEIQRNNARDGVASGQGPSVTGRAVLPFDEDALADPSRAGERIGPPDPPTVSSSHNYQPRLPSRGADGHPDFSWRSDAQHWDGDYAGGSMFRRDINDDVQRRDRYDLEYQPSDSYEFHTYPSELSRKQSVNSFSSTGRRMERDMRYSAISPLDSSTPPQPAGYASSPSPVSVARQGDNSPVFRSGIASSSAMRKATPGLSPSPQPPSRQTSRIYAKETFDNNLPPESYRERAEREAVKQQWSSTRSHSVASSNIQSSQLDSRPGRMPDASYASSSDYAHSPESYGYPDRWPEHEERNGIPIMPSNHVHPAQQSSPDYIPRQSWSDVNDAERPIGRKQSFTYDSYPQPSPRSGRPWYTGSPSNVRRQSSVESQRSQRSLRSRSPLSALYHPEVDTLSHPVPMYREQFAMAYGEDRRLVNDWEDSAFEAEELRRKAEEVKRREEEARRREEEIRWKEEDARRQAEDVRRQAEDTRRKEEEMRYQAEEAKRRQEEAVRLAEESRKKEDEIRRKEDEIRRMDAETRQREIELRRREVELEAKLLAQEARRKEEELHKKEEEIRTQQEALRRREEELARREAEAKRQATESFPTLPSEEEERRRSPGVQSQEEKPPPMAQQGTARNLLAEEEERRKVQAEREAREKVLAELEERRKLVAEQAEKQRAVEAQREGTLRAEKVLLEQAQKRKEATKLQQEEEDRLFAEYLAGHGDSPESIAAFEKHQQDLLRKIAEERRTEQRNRQDGLGNTSDSNRSTSSVFPSGYSSASSQAANPWPIPNRSNSTSSASSSDRASATSSSWGSSWSNWSHGTSNTHSSSSSRTPSTPSASAKPSNLSGGSTTGAWRRATGPGTTDFTRSRSPPRTPASSRRPTEGDAKAWQKRQEEQARKQAEAFKKEQERIEGERLANACRLLSKEEVAKLVQDCELQWMVLQTMDTLTWNDIPWPTLKKPNAPEDMTTNAISAYILNPYYPGNKPEKDRIKEHIRRWHPDRFDTKYLARVREAEREKVKEGAGVVARGLNELLSQPSTS